MRPEKTPAKSGLVCILLAGAFLFGCRASSNPESSLVNLSQRSWGNGAEEVFFSSSSGIVFHTGRGTLFVVGDEGDIGEISVDGEILNRTVIGDADLEGITFDPSTGLLYVVLEKQKMIFEMDPDTFAISRRYAFKSSFAESDYLFPGKKYEIEGITFLPNAGHPEGGNFYLTHKNKDGGGGRAPAGIIQVELPLRSSGDTETVRVVGFIPLNEMGLAGIHYGPDSGNFWLVSDRTSMITVVTPDGEVQASYPLPGKEQEGITVDEEGSLYIAQGVGAIIKIASDG